MKKPTPLISGERSQMADELIAAFRGRKWSDAEILQDLTGLRQGVPPWRRELLYALANANGIPVNALCVAVGVAPSVVMAARRKDGELSQAIQNYQGAYFEGEAQMPVLGVSAAVIMAGLEKHAQGWEPTEGRSLTDEDLQRIIRAIVDSVRLRVTDQEILKLIGQDIQATLLRFQGATPEKS